MARSVTGAGGAGPHPCTTATRRRRRVGWPRWTAVLLALIAGVVATAPPASSSGVAGARNDLQRARAELDALNVRLSLLAERVHQGKVLLNTLRTDLVAAKRRSERAREDAAAAAADLRATARRAYEGVGTTSGLSAVIGLHSVSDFLQGMDLLSALVERSAQVARNARDTRERAQQTADETRSLAAAQSHAFAQLGQDQAQMEAAVGAQRRLIGQLSERLKREVAQAIAARVAARQAAAQPPPGSGQAPGPGGAAPPPENQIDGLIYSIWGHGHDGTVAECIADHESGDNPNSRNASGAAGLFQLMPFWWDGNNALGWKFDPYDARANAEHAYLIWKRDSWNPWTTKNLCV